MFHVRMLPGTPEDSQTNHPAGGAEVTTSPADGGLPSPHELKLASSDNKHQGLVGANGDTDLESGGAVNNDDNANAKGRDGTAIVPPSTNGPDGPRPTTSKGDAYRPSSAETPIRLNSPSMALKHTIEAQLPDKRKPPHEFPLYVAQVCMVICPYMMRESLSDGESLSTSGYRFSISLLFVIFALGTGFARLVHKCHTHSHQHTRLLILTVCMLGIGTSLFTYDLARRTTGKGPESLNTSSSRAAYLAMWSSWLALGCLIFFIIRSVTYSNPLPQTYYDQVFDAIQKMLAPYIKRERDLKWDIGMLRRRIKDLEEANGDLKAR